MAGFLSLQWNNHSLAFINLLNSLHSKELYCDATIACHGKFYPVHRLVLSTCSEYFKEIFNLTQCKHPFIIVNDAQPSELEALLKFMYKGNINVPQNELPTLLKAAEALRVKGLAVPDNLSPEKEVPKKRSSSQNSSAKKLKVSNKEKINNDARRDSLVDDVRESSSAVFDDTLNNSIEKIKLIKEEPETHEDNEQIDHRLSQEQASSYVGEDAVKSEPYDPSYLDPQMNQEETHFLNNTEWPDDTGENNQANQQSPFEIINGTQNEESMNMAGVLPPFPATWNEGPDQLIVDSVIQNRIYRCLLCSYKSVGKRDLHQHVRTFHEKKEKHFTCSLCSYRSAAKYSMIIHMRTHTGEKPYPCPICGMRFADNSNRNRHIKSVHKLLTNQTQK